MADAPLSRREFFAKTAATGAAALAAGALLGPAACASASAAATATGAAATVVALGAGTAPGPDGFTLPELGYSQDALAPFMSAETFAYHYGKHHAGYIKKLNASVKGTPFAQATLEQIILSGDPKDFANAAQTWNHNFFWKCLKPGGGGAPTGALAAAIDRDFGSFEAFKTELAKTAAGQFGSGWGWLVLDAGKLKVVATSNADLPMKHGQHALFTVDVWEHAYYIDYRNDRAKFIGAVLDNLANWDFAAANLALAG